MGKPQRYFETFARKTTFQGFQELLDAKGWCEKGFWLVTIILALGFSILLIYLGCAHFFKGPVATTVTRSREGPVNLDVLYCPANWINVEKLLSLENASRTYLAYALTIFRGDNYPNKAAFPAVAPLTFDELKIENFTIHMQKMLTSILPINLVTNEKFKGAWENLKLDELFFLNPKNLPKLIESMTAEQVGQATILYVQHDFVGLAQYLLTNVRLQVASDASEMRVQFESIVNQTEYAQRPTISHFFYNFGTYTLLASIQRALRGKLVVRPNYDPECEIAPLLCCNEYGENCQSQTQYHADRLRPTPNELITMLTKIEMEGNTTALYAYVQEYLEQQVNETKNRLNETQPALTDQIWDYYQLLLVEYIISESYRPLEKALIHKYYIYDHWLPYKEITNFKFISTYMTKAALGIDGTYDKRIYPAVGWLSSWSLESIPKVFQEVQTYVRDNVAFQEFLNVTGAESSVQSMRKFFAQAKNTSEAAQNLLSQAIANWVAAEKTDYANFLHKNNFTTTYDFLQAISPNASQIIYSLSLSDDSVLRPPAYRLDIHKIFNQLGPCFRFSLFIESTSAHLLQSSHENVLFPTFNDRVYLNIYIAESNTLLFSFESDDSIFFGQEALEDYPRNGVKVRSDTFFMPQMWFNMDFSVTDFVFQSKLHRNSAPCRSVKNYSSRKCVAACNDQYANGALECSYYRQSGDENSEIFSDNVCSLFHLMRTSAPSAAAQRNQTDWNLLYKCYADCSPACDQWYMKKSHESKARSGNIERAHSTFHSSIRTMVERIGNAEGRPIEIPNGWSMSLVPALREAILGNSFLSARWLTCINLEISTEVTMYFEEFTYTWDALFGIVGGQVGLIMGASAISFVQLGYLFFAAWKKERRLQYKINQQPSGRSEVRSL